ncbi:mannosyl-oligosaccharide alpha-1,2-mannosidase [Massospora cicadina]|nr:mannosyl-oligosaccharide alpha-1,2-mannosidase [Massospora cicadina]
MLLTKATDLAQRLSASFDTKSGIPINHQHRYESFSSTAEAATLQLENKYISHILGDPHLWHLSQRVNDIIDEQPKLDGLVPIFIRNTLGLPWKDLNSVEYLLKQWLQTNKKQVEFLRRYDEALFGIKRWLLGRSFPNNLTFIGEINLHEPDKLSPKMDHLVCFMAGNLALGATGGFPAKHSNGTFAIPISAWDREALSLAESFAETCWHTYTMNPTGLAAEITVFNTLETKTKDAFVKPADTHNLLRPETDPKYREWGWKMFLAFEKHTKVEDGYVALSDATVIPPVQGGKMETFFLAETLKYFYLLFSAEDFLPLDKVVFNTEAHPFPRFTPGESFLSHPAPKEESPSSSIWQRILRFVEEVFNKRPTELESVPHQAPPDPTVKVDAINEDFEVDSHNSVKVDATNEEHFEVDSYNHDYELKEDLKPPATLENVEANSTIDL